MKPLTESQLAILRVAITGWAGPPWGYARAGGDASRWHRSAAILLERGLVEHRGCGVEITDEGRAALGEAPAPLAKLTPRQREALLAAAERPFFMRNARFSAGVIEKLAEHRLVELVSGDNRGRCVRILPRGLKWVAGQAPTVTPVEAGAK